MQAFLVHQAAFTLHWWNLSAQVGMASPNNPDDVQLVQFGFFCMGLPTSGSAIHKTGSSMHGSFPDRHLPRAQTSRFRLRSQLSSSVTVSLNETAVSTLFPRRAIPTRTEAADTPS